MVGLPVVPVAMPVVLLMLAVLLLLLLVPRQAGVQLGGRQIVAVALPHDLRRVAAPLHVACA